MNLLTMCMKTKMSWDAKRRHYNKQTIKLGFMLQNKILSKGDIHPDFTEIFQ